MTIDETIYTALAPIFASRVHPDFIPQGWVTDADRRAALRYSLVAAEPDNTICGSTAAADQVRVQFDIYCVTKQELDAKTALVRAAMEAIVDPPVTRELELRGYEEDLKMFVRTQDWVFHPSA